MYWKALAQTNIPISISKTSWCFAFAYFAGLLDSVYNMWTLNLPPVATLLGDSNAKFRGNHLTKSLE